MIDLPYTLERAWGTSPETWIERPLRAVFGPDCGWIAPEAGDTSHGRGVAALPIDALPALCRSS
jgi:hypothetical protein